MADVCLYRCASSARHWRRRENVNRHHSSSSRNTRQKRMCRIRMKNELRRHSECQPCIKTDKNKLIDIHRISCPIFSDAKSQCAHGNNAKRYIITAALLNFCGWSGTEFPSGRETWEGGLEILSQVNIWLELQHDPLWVKLHIYRRCTSDDTHTAHGCVKPWHPLDIIKLSPLVLGAIILCDLLGIKTQGQ